MLEIDSLFPTWDVHTSTPSENVITNSIFLYWIWFSNHLIYVGHVPDGLGLVFLMNFESLWLSRFNPVTLQNT